MTKAEERALQEYPSVEGDEELSSRRASHRISYERGYNQAIKDNELTWEDMRAIYETFDALDNEHNSTFNMGIQQYFKEALKRFNQKRNC